ncbi:MAG: hypothetical protein SGI86_00810 [Deltaproteobacteria bacterium]|nr:hypothetical protein [Deltaproteobacteria bacterium]
MRCTRVFIERAEGNFQCLAPEGAIYVEESTPAAAARAVIVSGWIYLVGEKPQTAAANGYVEIGASGTSMVVQQMPELPGKIRVRAYVRSAPTGHTATIVHGGVYSSDPIAPGQFADCVVGKSGTLIAITSPATFDENNPPAGSEGLIGEVDTERAARGVQ